MKKNFDDIQKLMTSQHTQKSGMAYYDDTHYFQFAHGRVSKTKDGAIQLTLKVYCDEGVNISETIAAEAEIARDAIVEYQLKR